MLFFPGAFLYTMVLNEVWCFLCRVLCLLCLGECLLSICLFFFSLQGTFPIDLTKTRLQVQGQVNDAKYKEIRYRGMMHALVRIFREEGLKALYSG